MKSSRFLSILIGFLLVAIASAQVPKKISYQGVLTYTSGVKQKPVKAGTYSLRFNFYDASTSGVLLTYFEKSAVSVDKTGLYKITLGDDGTDLGSLDLSAFNSTVWLEVVINSVPSGERHFLTFPYTYPTRVQFTTVPYAATASQVSSTADLSIHSGDFTGDVAISGGTTLGTGAPSVKMKKLTGTISSSNGGAVQVNTGIAQDNILSVSVLVKTLSGASTPPRSPFFGENYSFYVSGTTLWIENIINESSQIQGRPFTVLIIYQ